MRYILPAQRMVISAMVLVAASLLFTSMSVADSSNSARPPAQWVRFLQTFDEAAQRDQIVGASAALIAEGQLVARHDYGLADRASRQATDADTIFHWGSITKTLTAITVMQLRDRGKLSLDDPVTRYIPELRRVHNAFGSMDDVTIRMLLDHSAGFQRATWPYKHNEAWEPFEPTSWEQLVAMMPYEQVAFEPGSRYQYSNPGFIYLARIVQILTGDAWESYVQKNVFAPLGMTRSYFGHTPYYLQAHRSSNYNVRRQADGTLALIDNGREFDPGVTIPNGGWNAPMADLVTYVAFLTNAARGDATLQRRFDTVLARATLEEMWKPRFPAPTNHSTTHMGLSFFVTGEGAKRIIGHTGSQAGFTAFVYFNPATARAVVAVFNTSNYTHGDRERSSFNEIQGEALAILQ